LSTIARAARHVARWFYGRHDAAYAAITRSDYAHPARAGWRSASARA